MTSASGTAAKPSVDHDVDVARGVLRVALLRQQHAMPTTSATFANSEGWTEKPAGSTIHECEPLIVDPSGESTATRPAIDIR